LLPLLPGAAELLLIGAEEDGEAVSGELEGAVVEVREGDDDVELPEDEEGAVEDGDDVGAGEVGALEDGGGDDGELEEGEEDVGAAEVGALEVEDEPEEVGADEGGAAALRPADDIKDNGPELNRITERETITTRDKISVFLLIVT
jgi:hypothetical protein